jgi:LuxR family maltose regulon positive regulatory protein
MVETITPEVPLAFAHIIERPRLTEQLEEGARLAVFAAPAGFGKTTLARQWGEKQDCPVVWYRTNRSSGDIALLAVQFDELFARLWPEAPRDPRKVAAIAAANPIPSPLGRALIRNFGEIDQDILVIVDEWEAAETPESDELLSMLVEGIPVRWVITSRERPRWFKPRRKIYGDALEIGVNDLRMTDAEAAQVLAAAGAESGRAKVMRTAAGWPAVLGLAAMSGEVDFSSDRLLSHTLDEYLADELLAAATPETQEALMLLAISSIVDLDRAKLLLGEAAAKDVVRNASVQGLLAVSEGTALFLHPLLRDLVTRRFKELSADKRAALLARCRRLLDSQLWDEALSVAEHSLDGTFTTAAIAAGLDALLDGGRSSSLGRWVSVAREANARGGLVDYAEAELRLREGSFDPAVALGACAGEVLGGDLAARAHLVAARAAHLANRTKLRDKHLALAGKSANQPKTESDFRWLRFVAAHEDERPIAYQLADELLPPDQATHDHALRVATANLHMGLARGPLLEHLEAAQTCVALVDTASDPYTSTSTLNLLAFGLYAAGRYSEALAIADKELKIAREFELPFVFPYAEVNRASCFTALRDFARARRALSNVERHVRATSDPYLMSLHAIQSAALELAHGNLDRALEHLAPGEHPRAAAGIRGEHNALRSLVLTALGRFEEATRYADKALDLTHGIEARALLSAASAVSSAVHGQSAECIEAYKEIVDSGYAYVLPLAWRARFEVAATLLTDREHRGAVLNLLVGSKDTAIAKRSGVPVPRQASRRLDLSPREEEVCELLAEGRTNQEIATMLFISLSTTKVHVKHILEKLGVRSRVEAARVWEDGL